MRNLRKALWAFQRAYGGCVVVSTAQLPSSGGTIYPQHSSRAEMWRPRFPARPYCRVKLQDHVHARRDMGTWDIGPFDNDTAAATGSRCARRSRAIGRKRR
ncbi:hypothetical protein GCM10010342_28150 [Streptomyces anulatus]|nr:hypothetical protein GCM10010342_28150 [Streptomyces anulatus]